MSAAEQGRADLKGATILIVDDAPENLVVLGEVLAPHYRVRAAASGPAALRIAQSAPQPDLILLDIMMPGMDGFAVIERLRADPATRDIPVVFITAMTSVDDETKGLELGAADYITKPIQPPTVLARVRTQLELKHARDWLRDKNAVLEAEVARRMAETRVVQDVAIRALARLAEVRDPVTGAHLLRTQAYVGILADHLSLQPRFREVLTPYQVDLIVRSAPLHDIGKVGIPDSILLKPGRLTPEERAIMQTHTTLGSAALETVQAGTERQVDFLATAREIVRWHHEKWDGTGYPDGLAGEAIPLSARLMAVADVFDALHTRRVYKAALPMEEVLEIMAAERGRHFDPDVLDAFLEQQARFAETAERHADARPATG